MTAPERIYLQLDIENDQPLEDATWCVDQIEDFDTEFIRADASPETVSAMPGALALVAAAYRAGAKAGSDAAVDYWSESKKPVSERKHGGSGLPGCVTLEILALTPADALAALDAMIAEARKDEREKAASFVESHGTVCLGQITPLSEKSDPPLTPAGAALAAEKNARHRSDADRFSIIAAAIRSQP